MQTEYARMAKIGQNSDKQQLITDVVHANSLTNNKRKDFFTGKQVNLFGRGGIAGQSVISLTTRDVDYGTRLAKRASPEKNE